MPQPKSPAGRKPRRSSSRLPSASGLLSEFVKDSQRWRETLNMKLDTIIDEQHSHREEDRLAHASLGNRVDRLDGTIDARLSALETEGMPKRLYDLETGAAVRDGQEKVKRLHIATWVAVGSGFGGGAIALGVEFLKKKFGW